MPGNYNSPDPDGVVHGTSGDDLIDANYVDHQGDQVSDDGDVVIAVDGNDTIYSGDGNDTVMAGGGDDHVFAGDGNDIVFGEGGNDTLEGEGGDDKLIGGNCDDLLIGGDGNNTMYGDNYGEDDGGSDPSDPAPFGVGNDTLVSGTGNDSMYGGGGDDVFEIRDDFGNHLIVGGETGEVIGDTIDASGMRQGADEMTQDVTVTFTDDEQGTITRDGATINFSEIENILLGGGDDNVQVLTSTTGYVSGGDGFDTLVLPDADPGDPAPVVTITSSIDNGDGTWSYDGYVIFPDGSRLDFHSFEKIICFTPGTMIDTARGRVAVEDLAPGDRVLTRDNGYQELVWTGRRGLGAAEAAAVPAVAPVRIAAGALGRGLPERDLRVSPRHRMLISGPRAELMFGEREVLVAAIDLVGLPGITQEAPAPVEYIHVMCARHEILRAEGSWSESFHAAPEVLDALEATVRDELLALFPELATPEGQHRFAAARMSLGPVEARALFAA